MVASARRALGPISILINNAGIVELEDIGDFTDASWDRVTGVNLVGPANCVRACAIDIRAAGDLGRIVNIGSVLGRWPLPGRSAYAASKAGLEMLTQVWALEFGTAGATANMVVPGTIVSDMTAPVLVSAESRAMTVKPIPLGRIGTPADIGAAVSFLCTAAAGYITGVSILVDGGLSLTPDARGATGNPMPARESPA
jgi:NAD(P)-dependent dehydrogenase (short-subunit alcohol dehydrogenase family)